MVLKLGIRGKFIGILVIAAVLPLGIAISLIQALGFHHYKRERGRLFQSAAMHLATSVNLNLSKEVERVEDWLTFAGAFEWLAPRPTPPGGAAAEALQAQIDDWETRWPELATDSPELQSVLTNSRARQLAALRSVNPLVAEVFITDAAGRVVATTHKTSDYYQADELWWQRAMRVRHGFAYLEGVHFDQSAQVHSIDVCVPIRARDRPYDPPVGVLKAVLDASPLFASGPRLLREERLAREIIVATGQVVSDLFREDFEPLHQAVDAAVARQIAAAGAGWKIATLDDRGPRLVGFAPLNISEGLIDRAEPDGMVPMYVLVHDDAVLALAPVRRQLWLLGGAGAGLLALFTLAGLYIASRKLLAPIRALQAAAKAIAESAQLNEAPDPPDPRHLSPECARRMEAVQQIETHDELQELAVDFSAMARRVLTYHEQLEEELAAKTAEIQRDLQFAREFQEALMPRQYPLVPSAHLRDPVALQFHHIYKPASSVGGDFFDVVKLSDHQAGVFIADVMGHGARSALVTAILRTLLQDLAVAHGNDPARLLSDINQHFFDITAQSNQFIFVSAFYLVIDTQRSLATYASAGHPSPLLADRVQRKVRTLIDHLQNNPALGLYRESKYTNFTSFIKPGDVFVLFTDGVFEVTRANGEDFGRDRVRRLLEENIDLRVKDLCEALFDAVTAYAPAGNLPDDLCLVGVDIVNAVVPEPVIPTAPRA